ncbi:hypothetical protein PCANC_07606 [Puccinia coronata f. sp. avenae]|uniref:Uncharacterized protein n=1 Tax=Puccinia coronata f. sp. avenae TaxID=200324 RepID=A0A2N5SYD9_9BASI|nr:hypothetical protein PCASD_16082 [Puccinia coronata f. sp. avenae]PLW46842.1 hypothetical protein PCASD_06011 [Puccinia coronata f. sp. avenae]PLW50422.1 hypothetical protein PCANC_07606 [Puccinia coronata f. sp. avenae]
MQHALPHYVIAKRILCHEDLNLLLRCSSSSRFLSPCNSIVVSLSATWTSLATSLVSCLVGPRQWKKKEILIIKLTDYQDGQSKGS